MIWFPKALSECKKNQQVIWSVNIYYTLKTSYSRIKHLITCFAIKQMPENTIARETTHTGQKTLVLIERQEHKVHIKELKF